MLLDQKFPSTPLEAKVSEPIRFMQAEILGATVHAMRADDMNDAIAHAIHGNKKWLIAHHNLHSFYLLQKEMNENVSSRFQRFYQRADWTNIDGMSMVLLARLRGYPVSRVHRFSYSYTLRSMMALAQRHGWRVFYLGSSAAVVEKAKDLLKVEFPKLVFSGRDGFFEKNKQAAGNREVLAEIAAFRPNILYVGMGMPCQEYWVEENYPDLHANVILTSGATLEYIAGSLRTPPDWVGRFGLQWLYRLIQEPRRLSFRYLVEPWMTLRYVAQNRIRARKRQ